MLKIVNIIFFNYITVQAFPVFTFDGSLDAESPSFASLVKDVWLPENFIVCSSSKMAIFNYVGFYSIFREDSKDWLTVVIQPLRGAIVLAIFWDGEFHVSGELGNAKLDHWYHTCLKIDLSRKEIKFAVNGVLLGKAVGKNITNLPSSKLKMNIGLGLNNKQFHGSVASIQVFKEGDIKEISSAPCREERETLLSWNPQLWKVVGSHWLLTEEYKETICYSNEHYNLAVPSGITFRESMDLCKEKLNNSVIPYPENQSAFLSYVAWQINTTGGACPGFGVWTPLSDQNSEGLFLNMNNNSTVHYQNWDNNEPNGGKRENFVVIDVRTAALSDVEENRLFCSACSISSSLVLRLDGVCEDSFIGM